MISIIKVIILQRLNPLIWIKNQDCDLMDKHCRYIYALTKLLILTY